MQVGEIVLQFYLTLIKTTYHMIRIPFQLCINEVARQRLASKANVLWISFDCSGIMCYLVVL